MAISRIVSTLSDDFQLISSVTPTVAATINFTNVPLNRKLILVLNGVVLSSAGYLRLTINNISTDSYYQSNFAGTIGTSVTGGAVTDSTGYAFFLDSSTTANKRGFVVLENCDSTGLKRLTGGHITSPASIPGGSTPGFDYSGIAVSSAVVTQVTLTATQNFTAVGTVSLYGAK